MERPRQGFSLLELMITLAVLGILAALAINQGSATLARMRVESGARRVALGLEMGRAAAERGGRPCALQLTEQGWHPPEEGALPACEGVELALGEGGERDGVELEHNLPETVRFSSNGLVLDGGTVRVSSPGTALVRCLVMSLPLGVVRLGRQEEGGCRPDPS